MTNILQSTSMLNARSRVVLATLLPGLFEAGFDGFHARFEKTAPASMVLGFRAALAAATWVAPLLIGRLPPLGRLAPEERARALEALGSSRFYLLRQTMLLLKAVACFCYAAHPDVRRQAGYPS